LIVGELNLHRLVKTKACFLRKQAFIFRLPIFNAATGQPVELKESLSVGSFAAICLWHSAAVARFFRDL
jgi:hypothetical protein